jgi:hypothetical protein
MAALFVFGPNRVNPSIGFLTSRLKVLRSDRLSYPGLYLCPKSSEKPFFKAEHLSL